MRSRVVAVVVVASSFASACRGDDRHASGAKSAAPERHDDAERRQRIDAEVSATPHLTTTPCTHDAPPAPGALGDLSLSFDNDRQAPGGATESYLLLYLRLIGSRVEVVAPLASHAPLARRDGFDGATTTLVIDAWTDPVIAAGATTFQSGQLTGRVLLWDPKARDIVCGARVTATNNAKLTLVDTMSAGAGGSSEEALSKARVDLVNEALRAGLGSLVEVAH